MPPASNPNPDRARRAHAPAPSAPAPTRDEGLPEAVAPTTTVTAPAPAPAAAAANAVAVPRPSPAAPTGIFGIMPVRATGLQQRQVVERKRTASVVRDGQIQTAQKARMQHKTADKLVFCHEAMYLQLRMQDAGWTADVERWESDTDSDASADEAEADETAGDSLSEAQLLRLMA